MSGKSKELSAGGQMRGQERQAEPFCVAVCDDNNGGRAFALDPLAQGFECWIEMYMRCF